MIRHSWAFLKTLFAHFVLRRYDRKFHPVARKAISQRLADLQKANIRPLEQWLISIILKNNDRL